MEKASRTWKVLKHATVKQRAPIKDNIWHLITLSEFEFKLAGNVIEIGRNMSVAATAWSREKQFEPVHIHNGRKKRKLIDISSD